MKEVAGPTKSAKAASEKSPALAAPAPSVSAIPPILQLQRTVGNLAVQRLIQRKCACGGQTGSGGECEECRAKHFLQREAVGGARPSALPAIVHEAMHTRGKPLDHGSRDFMESRFHHDFGDVRVHTDPAAEGSARTLGAEAYTSGLDIYFAAGKYAPQSSEGRRLLAHELAHTVQQRGMSSFARQAAPSDNLDIDPDDSLEREAERAAEQVASSDRAVPRPSLSATDVGSIQRQAEHDLTRISIQPEFTQTLSDEELQSESLHLRQRLSQLAFEDPEHAVIQQNLYLVIIEARRRFVELPAPEPGEDSKYEFRGRILTTDPISIRYILEQLIVETGESPAEFIADLQSDLDDRSRDSDQARQIFQGLKRALLPVLQTQLDILIRENTEFLREFEKTAKETLRELLQKSEDRLNAERVRYGIPANEFLGDRPLGTTLAQAGLEQTPELGELQEAVNLFVRLRAQRDDRVENLKKEITSLRRLKAQNVPGKEDDPETILMADQIEKDRRDIDLETRLFQVRKAELVRLYPILASWIGDDDSSVFHRVGFFPNFDAMAVMVSIQAVIVDKLGNIAKVRGDLDEDKLNIWKLPRLIAATRARMHVPEDLTIRWWLTEEMVEYADDKGFWASIGLPILQFALVLLAPLTEGATLIPAAAISGYTLFRHGEEFLQQSALAGTDFDKALAISADKPSSFRLALDAVLFLADTGAALKAFEKLAALIPEIRAARTLEEAERIVRTAVPEGSEEFARRIVSEARAGEGVSTAERILGKESRDLENLRELAEREAKDEEGLLASAATATGDTAKVTEGGHLVICSEPCQWMRERFARQLGRNSSFEGRLADLERRSAAAAKADKATAKALADKIAEDAAVLQRDLAYAEYIQAGGRDSLQAFVAAERLRAIVTSTAHASPTLLSTARIARIRSALAADFPVVSRLSDGAIERVVRAAHRLAEEGGLERIARGAIGRARGQLLEELASVRMRDLLSSQAGREALGLGDFTEPLEFIEGSRIGDAAGAMLTDGIIGIRRGRYFEIVAVLEAKAGKFAAGGLTESLSGLRRATTSDIIEGVLEAAGQWRRNSGIFRRIAALDPEVADLIAKGGANLAKEAEKLRAIRERLMKVLESLPEKDLNAIRKAMSVPGEGQIVRDIERLLLGDDGPLELIVDGQKVRATVPTRPRFLGVAPQNVPLTDIEKELNDARLNFRSLEMGTDAMTKEQLDQLADKLVKDLGPDLIEGAEPE